MALSFISGQKSVMNSSCGESSFETDTDPSDTSEQSPIISPSRRSLNESSETPSSSVSSESSPNGHFQTHPAIRSLEYPGKYPHYTELGSGYSAFQKINRLTQAAVGSIPTTPLRFSAEWQKENFQPTSLREHRPPLFPSLSLTSSPGLLSTASRHLPAYNLEGSSTNLIAGHLWAGRNETETSQNNKDAHNRFAHADPNIPFSSYLDNLSHILNTRKEDTEVVDERRGVKSSLDSNEEVPGTGEPDSSSENTYNHTRNIKVEPRSPSSSPLPASSSPMDIQVYSPSGSFLSHTSRGNISQQSSPMLQNTNIRMGYPDHPPVCVLSPSAMPGLLMPYQPPTLSHRGFGSDMVGPPLTALSMTMPRFSAVSLSLQRDAGSYPQSREFISPTSSATYLPLPFPAGTMAQNDTGRRSTVTSDKTPALKKYKCDVCGKAFSRSNTLVTHKRIHTGAKPFSCETCGRAFRQPGNLTRHRLTHTTLKPYVCHCCHKAFNRASNLHTHMRTHASHKAFICPHQRCGRVFQHRMDMKLHSYTHLSQRRIETRQYASASSTSR